MDSVAVTVPLRPPTKKMKKRKELDALAPPHAVSRRSSGKRSSQELLTDSSDERSEYWNVSTRSGRKCRGRRGRACPGLLKACSAFLACASVLATASLIWLFIDVRQQLSALRTELDQVIAGSEGVPDALHKCHSLSRDLQNDQTIIFTQLSDLKLQINNFTTQVAGIQIGLHQVQEWFQDAPQLTTVPKDLKTLSNTVLSFGSQIEELGATVNTLKEANTRVQGIQSTMQQNITSIKHSLLEFSNVTQKPQMSTINETKIKTEELNAAILQLKNNLTHVNETLTRKTQWVSEDQKKDHDTLVGLQDTAQDVSMKLMSLQTECAKESRQVVLSETIQKLSDQFNTLHAPDMTDKLKELEKSYNALKNTTNMILVAISDIQNQQQLIKSKQNAGSFNFDLTTEADRGASDANESAPKKSTNKPKRLTVGQN